jgi:DNA-nicking Smr family endonuclease
MKRKREVQADEAAMFRAAIGEVRPLGHDRVDARPEPPPPHPKQTLEDDAAVTRELASTPLAEMELEMAEPLAYVKNGVAARILRRLGRGEYSVRDELDLHHMTAAVAARAMAGFLDASRRSGRLCVRIVHGKGLRSKGDGPVLKGLADRLLRQRGDVIAFRSARAADGGTGAVIVLLRPGR